MVELLELNQSALQALCQKHKARRLSVFGSAARGSDFDPDHSDLDFLVEFYPMSATEKARAYFSLLFALEELFEHPVDLMTVESIKNP